MKKYLILTLAAAAALAACSKVNVADNDAQDRPISFQVASFQSTKADPADYKTDYAKVHFGAYAWFKGNTAADNAVFMTNQKVSYNQADNAWLPEGSTYYWPKSGSLDFICYSPYSTDTKMIAVAEDKITFTGYTAAADDLMYGDKAVGLKDNAKTYYYTGVPVLFHHALAKVAFQVRAAYVSKKADTGDTTKWEIIVNSATVKGVRTTGDLALALNGTAWTVPASKVWTPTDAKKDVVLPVKDLKILTADAQPMGASQFVLPQALSLGQEVTLNITIKTYRDTGKGFELVLTENNIEVKAPLTAGNLKQWGINQDITYTFVISPTRYDGKDPEDPTKPVDPNNPNLDKAVIKFDPAVSEWELVTLDTTINL